MDICYNYSSETGEYLGASPFRRDPIENLPLIPAYATEVAPPACEEGWIPVYADGAWTLAEDHRGAEGYVSGEAVTISSIGPLPEGWSDTPQQPTLAQAKVAKLAAIQAEKTRARDGGFMVNGALFDSDEAARVAYLELAMKLQADPGFSTAWKASDGVWVTMNTELFSQVYAAGANHIAACFAWQGAREAEVAAAESVEAVELVSERYS